MSNLTPGTILNRNCYKITRFIKQGGFGITYLAEEIGYYKQNGFGDEEYTAARYPETVVVKELYYSDYCQRNEYTGVISISNTEKKVEFEKLVSKQLEEGKILRSLKHSNIIHTRDIFKENDTAYMVMDYVDSTDLEEIVKVSGSLGIDEGLLFISQILSAAKYIHGLKILHLDITPSNILIKKDTKQAVLIDFGASLTYDNESKVKGTTSKLVTGMRKHFAPNEQADIDNLKQFDATFDTYAIGATLYFLLTGRKPPLSSMVSTGREKITPVSTFYNGEISDYFDAVILKAMAPKFFDRFDNVAEFETMLSQEKEYSDRLRRVNGKVITQQFADALGEISEMEERFLSTESLSRLKVVCNSKLQENSMGREYDLYFSNGMEWFNSQNYLIAKREFERAASIYPQRAEPREKIKLCNEKLSTNAAGQKVESLLNVSKAQIGELKMQFNGRLVINLRNNISSILQIAPDHGVANQWKEWLDNYERKNTEEISTQAAKFFLDEKYAEAKIKYELLSVISKDDLVYQRLGLLTDENIRDVSDLGLMLQKWQSILKDFDMAQPGSVSSFKDILASYSSMVDNRKIEKIKLPAAKIKREFTEIGKSIELIKSNMKNEIGKPEPIESDRGDETIIIDFGDGYVGNNNAGLHINKNVTEWSDGSGLLLALFLLVVIILVAFLFGSVSIMPESKKSIEPSTAVDSDSPVVVVDTTIISFDTTQN